MQYKGSLTPLPYDNLLCPQVQMRNLLLEPLVPPLSSLLLPIADPTLTSFFPVSGPTASLHQWYLAVFRVTVDNLSKILCGGFQDGSIGKRHADFVQGKIAEGK